jgi:hypothetical protein
MPMMRCAAVVVLLGAPLLLQAQAVIEYGAIAAKSAATTSGAAAAMNRVTQHLGSSVEHQDSTVRARSKKSAAHLENRGGSTAPTIVPSSSRADFVVQGAVPKNHPLQPQPKYRKSVTVSFDQ